MKKLFILLCFSLTLFSAGLIFPKEASAESIIFSQDAIKSYIVSGKQDKVRNIFVGYSADSKKPIILLFKGTYSYSEYYVSLDSRLISEMFSGFEKYFEWEKVATENKVKTEKEINRFLYTEMDNFSKGLQEGDQEDMVFAMHSKDINRHQLNIILDSGNSGSGWRLDKEEVVKFKKLLTGVDSKVAQEIDKINKEAKRKEEEAKRKEEEEKKKDALFQ